jgi:hypothetical protein
LKQNQNHAAAVTVVTIVTTAAAAVIAVPVSAVGNVTNINTVLTTAAGDMTGSKVNSKTHQSQIQQLCLMLHVLIDPHL